MNKLRDSVAIGLLLLLPATAQANAGTPLILFTLFHLFIGNALLGIAEGWLLARLVKLPMLTTMLVLIAANYLSACGGAFCLAGVGYFLTVGTFWPAFYLSIPATFALTVAIEGAFVLPFCLWHDRQFWPSARRFVMVQLFSYTALLVVYLSQSHMSMLKATTLVPLEQITLHDDFTLFYIDERDDCIYSRPLKGISTKMSGPEVKGRRLALQRQATESENWDLVLAGTDWGARAAMQPELVKRHAANETTQRISSDTEKRGLVPGAYFGVQKVSHAGSPIQSAWEVYDWAGTWGRIVLYHKDDKTRRKALWMHNPLVTWSIGHPFLLPGDFLLFRLGREILLLDIETMQLAVVCEGDWPIVVLTESSAE